MIRFTSKYSRNGREFNTIFTIWEIKENTSGKSANAVLTTSRELDPNFALDKQKIDDGLASEYNGKYYMRTRVMAQFVQEAFNKIKKHELNNGARITNLIGELTCELYATRNSAGERIADGEGKFINRYGNPAVKVIDFDIYTSQNNVNTQRVGIDRPPVVEEEKETPTIQEDEYPF